MNDWSLTCYTAAFQALKEAIAPNAIRDPIKGPVGPKKLTAAQITALKEAKESNRVVSDRDSCVAWLDDPANTSKYLILGDKTNIRDDETLQLATFAFSRSDPSRSHPGALIATIAYQICLSAPAATRYVLAAVDDDPFVFARPLEYQFTSLVLDPSANLMSNATF